MPAQRRLLKKASALAIVAGACRLAARGATGIAFAPAVSPAAAAPAAAGERASAEQDADARVLADALNGATAAASSVLVPQLESGDRFVEKGSEMALNPPWTTCFVEADMTGSNVLEEWVMRGERGVVDAFQAWRRSSEEPTSVRCVDTPAEEAMQSACLECAALEEAPAQGVPFTIAGRQSMRGVMTFAASSSQCLASAAKGQSFCKSGQVMLG